MAGEPGGAGRAPPGPAAPPRRPPVRPRAKTQSFACQHVLGTLAAVLTHATKLSQVVSQASACGLFYHGNRGCWQRGIRSRVRGGLHTKERHHTHGGRAAQRGRARPDSQPPPNTRACFWAGARPPRRRPANAAGRTSRASLAHRRRHGAPSHAHRAALHRRRRSRSRWAAAPPRGYAAGAAGAHTRGGGGAPPGRAGRRSDPVAGGARGVDELRLRGLGLGVEVVAPACCAGEAGRRGGRSV